jgi:hypothetical protein
MAWKVVLWLALNLSDARTLLSASQEHLFVELLRLLQSRGLLLTWRTKQQRHELFVQFVRQQTVTKRRGVIVPLTSSVLRFATESKAGDRSITKSRSSCRPVISFHSACSEPESEGVYGRQPADEPALLALFAPEALNAIHTIRRYRVAGDAYHHRHFSRMPALRVTRSKNCR